MNVHGIRTFAVVAALALAVFATPLCTLAQGDVVLKAADAQKLVPATVYYKAQTAPTQLRNSGGVKFADGFYVLAALVDTSGYSSDVATKYQGYFIAEVPLKIGGKSLPAGAYGFGFIPGKLVITDIGAHDILSVSSTTDQEIKRPMPLEFTTNPAGGFRFYVGRKYVTFSR